VITLEVALKYSLDLTALQVESDSINGKSTDVLEVFSAALELLGWEPNEQPVTAKAEVAASPEITIESIEPSTDLYKEGDIVETRCGEHAIIIGRNQSGGYIGHTNANYLAWDSNGFLFCSDFEHPKDLVRRIGRVCDSK